MPAHLEALKASVDSAVGNRVKKSVVDRGEITIEVSAADLLSVMKALRDEPTLAFSTLIDVIGMDYDGFGDQVLEGPRYAVVYNLLSIIHNWRLRVKVFAPNNDLPVVDSMIDTWAGANWFEREAFDLYGIVFKGHNDLRRILTDYGFVGHPFRKDFPVSGYVEMRYDESQRRVVYQPVSIEPREIVPRVIREDQYGDAGKV
ncbi:NAD(P)H-quinone oxidoreductase subunit J, chloroplastic [Usitatibacter rugosus]|uniref:NADH-quinone oxidoreductase subunit C n=1 Tax=Usitatibacter rugosus TaxID=2732067 RepID=A0A6M4GZM4_9PROT|nr:NADH-quinone oxidoreductase subunit C [Usitatibacter rugosus]QJR12318.1 NAD(P)H-quinone oxidoreductase subunit J, chloroplastic [Usitatibacter rugosus]